MKTFMICENLYNDIDSMYAIFKDMDFKESSFGFEVQDFQYIPQGMEEGFSMIAGENLEVQPDTGFFRKPNNVIHFDPFYQHCQWECIVAIEDTEITFWEQDIVRSLFDVESEKLDEFISENCADNSKWQTVNTIKLKKNHFILFRPWLWYSLKEEKIVQIFLLNKKEE